MRDGSDERSEGEDEGAQEQDVAPGRIEKSLVPILGSLGINFSISFLCMFIPWGVVDARTEAEVVLAMTPPAEEPPLPEPERAVEKNYPFRSDDPRDVVDPLAHEDFEVADHNETDDNQEFQEAKGDPDSAAQVDFDMRGVVDLMGVGGGGGGRYGHRRGGKRNRTVGMGGSRRTESAVKAALEWLRRHQSQAGFWDIDGFDAQCGREKSGRCEGHGTPEYDVGVTGLSLEAFLGSGYTHKTGDYKLTVNRGVQWLRSVQGADGCFGEKTGHFMYNHALATYAMAEAWLMEDDSDLRGNVQKAVDFLVAAQNPGLGWRYQNYNQTGASEQGGNNDSSVTGWVVMALKSAKNGGIEVPETVFQGANAWLDQCQTASGDYQVTYGYYGPGKFVYNQPYVTTAAGMIIRQFTGSGNQSAGIETLMGHLPAWGQCNMYEWYYAALAISQVDAPNGANWRTYNTALKTTLCDNQCGATQRNRPGERDTCCDGSWDPVCTWGSQGGRVYTTACGALCLEVYYRYLPMEERLRRERGQPEGRN